MSAGAYEIPVFNEAQGLQRVTLEVNRPGREFTLTCSLPGAMKPLFVSAPDCFAGLQEIRRKAEKQGWLLCCKGSRKNVWPSAIARDMGGGSRAYTIEMGKPAQRDSLVSIFEPDTPEFYCQVEIQSKYAKTWFKSLGF